jgi:hypothetical protein
LGYGAFRSVGLFRKDGDSSKGSTCVRCRFAAVAHQSSCEKHRSQYCCHFCGSSLGVPSSSSTSCAWGICTMAETGKHPNSLKTGRKAMAARTPPHCRPISKSLIHHTVDYWVSCRDGRLLCLGGKCRGDHILFRLTSLEIQDHAPNSVRNQSVPMIL